MSKKGLTPRSEDYSAWYNELVEKAELAQPSEVRGCMVIKPYGFAIWENIKMYLDQMFKNTGHSNAYFPLFIPKSYLSKEADHVEGFAKECAVVTHHRLMNNPDGPGVVVDPDAKLDEELIVRPTSETVIWRTYKDWIQSHRDLPLLINQWANVVRREMRTRVFLRTTEFLRQEGHTAHATADEAIKEAELMHEVYDDLMKNFLSIYGIKGVKSESERFAGAVETYTIEAMMQDGKALQSCTSHYLGSNFGDAFDVKYRDTNNEEKSVYATSRGMSTRIMGALIMSHSDDKGLVLPPVIAPYQIVIVPIFGKEENPDLNKYIGKILNEILGMDDELGRIVLDSETKEGLYTSTTHYKYGLSTFSNNMYSHSVEKKDGEKNEGYRIELPIRIKVDADKNRSPGWKFAEYEMKGVPIRIAVGTRDMENGVVEVSRRDLDLKEFVKLENLHEYIQETLSNIQKGLLETSKKRTISEKIDTRDEFEHALNQNKFVLAHRDGTAETEELIKQETKATIRCIPHDSPEEPGVCIKSGKPSTRRVLFAKAY